MEQVGYFRSPVGIYKITADDYGLTSLTLQEATENAPELSEQDNNPRKPSGSHGSSRHIRECIAWLETYFSDFSSLEEAKIPDINTREHERKPFCRKVWEILKDRVKAGEVVTYGHLAKMAGNPKGARAVGFAMKSNPISIIVPCHRVVKSGGDLGNYSSPNGVTTKKWLLQHENAISGN